MRTSADSARVMSLTTQLLRSANGPSITPRPNMLLSSESDSDRGKRKGFKIYSSRTLARWNGDDWTFYKHVMTNAFEESLLDKDGIAKVTLDDSWDDEQKGEYKKKQARITNLFKYRCGETCEASDDEKGTTRRCSLRLCGYMGARQILTWPRRMCIAYKKSYTGLTCVEMAMCVA